MMKKIILLLVVLVMVFAFTIPAAAGGNGPGGGIGPGDGTGPVGGLGPIGGNGSGGTSSGISNGPGSGIGPGDGTGPVGGLGPIGGNGSGGASSGIDNGPGSGIGPGDGTGPIGDLGPVRSGQGLALVPVIQARQGPRINFSINGAIFAIGADTVTINVTCGNKTAQPFIGLNKTVTVTPLTRYNSEVDLIESPISFNDLKVGDLVSLNGTVVNGVWTVRRITVVSALDCVAVCKHPL